MQKLPPTLVGAFEGLIMFTLIMGALLLCYIAINSSM